MAGAAGWLVATQKLTNRWRPVSIRRSGSLGGDVAQLGERRNGIAEVEGSIPFVSTKKSCHGTEARLPVPVVFHL